MSLSCVIGRAEQRGGRQCVLDGHMLKGTIATVTAIGFCLLSILAGRAEEPILLTSFRANIESQTAVLEWSGGHPPYRVQAATDNDFNWFDISEFLFGTSYTTPYSAEFTFFRVRTATDEVPPASPTRLTVATRNCDMLALLWERADDDPLGSGVDGYRVYRDGLQIGEVRTPTRFFLDKNASHESNFVYEVTALDLMGNESIRSSPLLVENAPCVAQNGPEVVTLSWDPATAAEIAGYIIYWGRNPGDYTWAMDAMDAPAVEIPYLEPEAAYFFAVTSYDSNGVQSDFSSEVAFITSSRISSP